VFARTKLSKPADKTFLNSFEDSSETKWHKTLDSANDYYYCQTFDGGYTWSEVMAL
jgi:hypothetical protein